MGPNRVELAEARHRAQAGDIGPGTLIGREDELAELVRFCAGNETYEWWSAPPWAGKTALAAWFVLHPPAGVRIASFFVTGQLAGQADSDAFTDDMIEQLAAIAGEPLPAIATRVARDGERRRLLECAAARVREAKGRLLLVVDGLDEDQGAKPGSGLPSIASVLPRHPPVGVRVLVTSRNRPGASYSGIPADVAADHPLRRCTIRELDAFQGAEDMQFAAQRELVEQLHADPLQIDLVAFITASGGGLTSGELAELSRHPKFLLDARLHGASGRSFTSRTTQDTHGRHDHVYLFAHETLHAIAERELAQDLGPYRERIQEWADQYRARGWPETTPQYLLRPYGRFLASRGDVGRLGVIAADAARHDRMLSHTHGDAAALAEIATTRQLLCDQVVPDLTTLALLAIRETRLAYRNLDMPARLPKVWALLGEEERGTAIARSISDPAQRAKALSGLVTGLAPTDPETARRLASEAVLAVRAIADPSRRVRAVCELLEEDTHINQDLAALLASEAEQAFNADTESTWRHSLVERLASIGDWDRAERVAISPDEGSWRDREDAVRRLIGLLADAGELDRAERAARAYPEAEKRAMALIELARTRISIDLGEATRLANEAAQEADAIDNSWAFNKTLRPLAEVLADAGQWDDATDIACHITDPEIWADVLSGLVTRLQKEDPALGTRLATEVEDAAFQPGYPPSRVTALSRLAFGLAEIDPERAMRLAAEAEATLRSFGDLWERLWRIRSVVAGLARLDPVRAGHLAGEAAQDARTVLGPESLAWVLNELVMGLAAAGPGWVGYLADQAETAARAIPDWSKQSRELDRLVDGLADAQEWDRAEETALAISEGRPEQRLGRLSKRLADGGEWDRAERVACAAQPPPSTDGDRGDASALRELVRRLVDAKEWDRAERAAKAIIDRTWQELALRDVVGKLVSAAEWDRAERVSKAIATTSEQAWDLGTVVKGLANAGEWDRAVRTAQSVPEVEHELRAWILMGLVPRTSKHRRRPGNPRGRRSRACCPCGYHREVASPLSVWPWRGPHQCGARPGKEGGRGSRICCANECSWLEVGPHPTHTGHRTGPRRGMGPRRTSRPGHRLSQMSAPACSGQ